MHAPVLSIQLCCSIHLHFVGPRVFYHMVHMHQAQLVMLPACTCGRATMAFCMHKVYHQLLLLYIWVTHSTTSTWQSWRPGPCQSPCLYCATLWCVWWVSQLPGCMLALVYILVTDTASPAGCVYKGVCLYQTCTQKLPS